jgi:hypothetical protein
MRVYNAIRVSTFLPVRTVNCVQTLKGQVLDYPTPDQMDTSETFRAVIQEDEKICKSWGTTWLKKRQKIQVSAPKCAVDGLVKAIRLAEKVGVRCSFLEQNLAPETAIGSHACWLEARACV